MPLSKIQEPEQEEGEGDMVEYWKWYQTHHEALRSILFLFGFILACLGVYLGFRRLAATEKQAETAEKNLFNDRLGRGVELLANDDHLSMRSAGVRVLENLAEGEDDESGDRALICKILLDFIQDKAAPPIDDNGYQYTVDDNDWPDPAPRAERADIELAIKALGDIAPENGPLDIDLPRLDLRRLNLRNANLQGAVLLDANLQAAFLSGANLQAAVLAHANLLGADFTQIDLQDVKGLTQEQLNEIVYETGTPPIDIPSDLDLPTHRAYEWRVAPPRRYFIESGQNVDEWIAKQIVGAKKN